MSNSPFELRIGSGGIATLTFDDPESRVNVLSRPNLLAFGNLVDELSGRSDIEVLVLLSGKKDNFTVGFDIHDIAAVDDDEVARKVSEKGQQVFTAWEELPFVTIAAIRGQCFGGGTELALASDWIVLSDRDDLRIGLPETRLGILPGWGGCVRLPRKIGIADALGIILPGKAIPPRAALKVGLADALVPDCTFLQEVRRFAEAHRKGSTKGRSRRLSEKLLEGNPLGRKLVFEQARKRTLESTGGNYPAPLRAIEVIRIGVDDGADAGFRAEARAIGELSVTPTCKNLVRLFLMMEQAKKRPVLEGGEAREISEAAVLGAGAMGGGIAQLIVDKLDLSVHMKDIRSEALATGLSHAARLFDKRVRKRRMRRTEAKRKLGLLRPTLDYSGLEGSDILVEAVVENLELKQRLFAEVAEILPADAVLATNTSSLSIDAIAKDVQNPERVVGMHFFNPVHRMPLVEVVVGERTGPAAVNTVLALARALGKTPVIVKDRPGFLVNRLLGFYMVEALWLLDEGHRMEVVDETMKQWGMPMGPFVLLDEVGLDVAMKVSQILAEAFPERLELPAWATYLAEGDRLGVKVGKGLYGYDGDHKRTQADPRLYTSLGLTPSITEVDPQDIAERLLLPLLNEAARCLEEELVDSPASLDLAMILGTGFPPFRGGPCRWADRYGMAHLVRAAEATAERRGQRYRPSDALRSIADAGGFYARWGETDLIEPRPPVEL